MESLKGMMSSSKRKVGLLVWFVCFGMPVLAQEPLETKTSTVPARPNVILVLVDDLGWTDLACYGSDYYETPNIDRLAAEGRRYEQAYAACAVCSPTRAAVLTGRYPARIGVTDWIRARFQGGKMPSDGKNPSGYVESRSRALDCPENALWMELEERTLAEWLRPAGYVSAHIGKWHLGMDPQYPEQQGFDFNFGGCDYGQPPSYFDPYANKKLEGIPTLRPRREGEYLTDREADEAVEFIRRHRDRPFFLYLAHYAVHTPIQGREDWVQHYRDKATGRHHTRPPYAAMVHSVDLAMGRLLTTLDELKLRENTLIVFTSDNGGLLGPTRNDPLRSGKGYPYEGGIRVPLILSWPGRITSTVEERALAHSIDLVPTVLAACAIEPDKDSVLDGRSLLTDTDDAHARDLFWHFPHYRHRDIGPYSIVRRGRWKLLRWWEGPRFELYDLQADPGESRDLSAEEEARVADLDRLLMKHLQAVGAKLPRQS